MHLKAMEHVHTQTRRSAQKPVIYEIYSQYCKNLNWNQFQQTVIIIRMIYLAILLFLMFLFFLFLFSVCASFWQIADMTGPIDYEFTMQIFFCKVEYFLFNGMQIIYLSSDWYSSYQWKHYLKCSVHLLFKMGALYGTILPFSDEMKDF